MTRRRALVTGAASGIGAATARRLAVAGYAVVVADRHSERAEKVVAQIRSADGFAEAVQVDLASESSVETMVKRSGELLEGLDVLVNNAGVNSSFTVEDCTSEEFDRIMAINFKGHFLCSRLAIPFLKRGKLPSIINIASTHSFRTQPRSFPYNAAKAALVGMTRSMAVDFASDQIRANAVLPGLIQTPIMDEKLFAPGSPFMQKVLPYHPTGRIGQPDDVAYAVEFLASEGASFVNGISMIVDGGRDALTYTL